MSEYVTKVGDTFESISRINFGREDFAGQIKSANPGVSDSLIPGTRLVIPRNPNALPSGRQSNIQVSSDKVSVEIDSILFDRWTNISINRGIDSVDTVELDGPFDPDSVDAVELFRPFSYADLKVFIGDEFLFTGTLIVVSPKCSNDSRTVGLGAYSIPGVLSDCTMPQSAYPISFTGSTLTQIAKSLCEPFGIAVKVEQGDGGAEFDQVDVQRGTTVMAILSKLSSQRNYVIGSNEIGDLVFRRSVAAGNPVGRLIEGEAPLVSVTSDLNAQVFFSHLTVTETDFLGSASEPTTVINKHLSGVLRPFTMDSGESDGASLETVVNSKMGRMYAESVRFRATVTGWRDTFGKLWKPNTTVVVKSPSSMIYSEYEFLIRSVRLTKTANSEIAELELTLPGVFDGKQPDSLPWDSAGATGVA